MYYLLYVCYIQIVIIRFVNKKNNSVFKQQFINLNLNFTQLFQFLSYFDPIPK